MAMSKDTPKELAELIQDRNETRKQLRDVDKNLDLLEKAIQKK